MGEEVGKVEPYKYLRVHLNNRLDWRTDADAVYKRGMSRLFSEETQIFQCMGQDAGDLLPV